jgi:Protein of unknown function (DUF3365)
MKRIISIQLIIVFFCSVFSINAIASGPENEIDPRVMQSRKAIKAFGTQLMGELKQAIAAGGPVNAIGVCNIKAPEIATNLSEQYNWQIGRTSLKTRNPNNNPDDWEQAVLNQFEQRKQQGEDIAKLDYAEDTEQGFRYMKAIPTKGLCLTCHGEAIPDNVKAALAEKYPQDNATGFKAGDIRGAFSIVQSK